MEAGMGYMTYHEQIEDWDDSDDDLEYDDWFDADYDDDCPHCPHTYHGDSQCWWDDCDCGEDW
jgi:hypothetical protein